MQLSSNEQPWIFDAHMICTQAQTGNATQHCDFPKEGRPAAALVAFGFGGNVVVFKPRRQEPTGEHHSLEDVM